MDTPGGRFRAQFDPGLPVSSLGALVFFAQYLAATGAFDALIADTPLCYASNRAHSPRDVLGTLLLGILSGHYRYAHLAALRGDDIAPRLLGLDVIVSEDCVRRALRRIAANDGRDWLRRHLDQSCHSFLDTKWVLDIDTTIKSIYGRQEGASVGYNPHKPGRPSHAYHTYWIASLRLCLDVEVYPGHQSAAGHGFDGLWSLIDRLPAARRPHLLRGDCAYGQEALLCEAERRGLNYLCKLRRTAKARDLVVDLERATTTAWTDAGQGWQGAEGHLRLQGWSRTRRVIVLRRRLNDQKHPRARRRLAREQARQGLFLSVPDATACEPIIYEHQILVTNLPYEILTLAALYRERGDAENPFDELKNQWSWSGFTTHDLRSCQHAAKLAALVYNWWTLYHRLLQPGQHHEAVSTRPRLLSGATRQTEHAGQRRLDVRLSHAEAPMLQRVIRQVSMWLQELLRNAQQWGAPQRWSQIVARILRENFGTAGPAPPSALLQA
ncbi:MAG: transposase [Opitutaceae bacterium]